MPSYTTTSSSNPGTAHPPLPRQPSMADWQARRREPTWKRVLQWGRGR